MNKFVLILALMVGAGVAQARDVAQLSDPIVAYVGVIVKNAEALALTDQQKSELKAWKATAQPKREALEDKVVVARTQLREMIITGAPKTQRMKLAKKIGVMETQLIMLRSNCVDAWRKKLTPEQFAKVVQMAKPVAQ